MLYEIDVSVNDPRLLNFFRYRGIDVANSPTEGYGNLLYFKTKDTTSIVTAAISSQQNHMSIVESNGLLNLKEKLTFYECTMLASLYFIEPFPVIENILSKRIESDSQIVAEILAPSNGHLVFNTQFEQLAQTILEVPREKSVQLRKFFNKKKESLQDLTTNVNSLTEFMRILDHHMLIECVLTPDFIGGKNLFLALQNPGH